MKTSWLHATLLPLFLFGTALLEKQNQCKGSTPEIKEVEVHGTVSVPCPSIKGQVITFTLHHGTNCSTVSRNVTHMKPIDASAGIIHDVKPEDNTSVFTLENVTEKQTGLYTCTVRSTFPPPILPPTEGPQIIVIVKERHQPTAQRCDQSSSDNHLSLWVGLGLLTLYGLIITCTAFSLRFRLTKGDINKHDYMNVKPRARRRNHQILHPPRMSWYRDNSASMASCKLSSKRLPV